MVRNKILTVPILYFGLILISCSSPEVSPPEYTKYDWYAQYTIDGIEHIMSKNGDDRNERPWVGSSQSYSYAILPDGSEDVKAVYMSTFIESIDDETSERYSISYNIYTPDSVLINMKDMSKSVRLERTLSYLSGREYTYNEESTFNYNDFSLTVVDKNGKVYRTRDIKDDDTIDKSLYYEAIVIDASKVYHEEYGDVIQVIMQIRADVREWKTKVDYEVDAIMKSFLIVPFEE